MNDTSEAITIPNLHTYVAVLIFSYVTIFRNKMTRKN